MDPRADYASPLIPFPLVWHLRLSIARIHLRLYRHSVSQSSRSWREREFARRDQHRHSRSFSPILPRPLRLSLAMKLCCACCATLDAGVSSSAVPAHSEKPDLPPVDFACGHSVCGSCQRKRRSLAQVRCLPSPQRPRLTRPEFAVVHSLFDSRGSPVERFDTKIRFSGAQSTAIRREAEEAGLCARRRLGRRRGRAGDATFPSGCRTGVGGHCATCLRGRRRSCCVRCARREEGAVRAASHQAGRHAARLVAPLRRRGAFPAFNLRLLCSRCFDRVTYYAR